MFVVNQENKWGKLYVVATPLGNLEDITLRAKNVLSTVAWIGCEDTRHIVRLLNAIGVQNRLIALHAHNENEAGNGKLNANFISDYLNDILFKCYLFKIKID